jgi:hypothetical protein
MAIHPSSLGKTTNVLAGIEVDIFATKPRLGNFSGFAISAAVQRPL